MSVEIAGYKNNFKIVKQIKESPGFYFWLSGTVNEEIHGLIGFFIVV